ncbi:MAG: homing endonuclease associated repeat-containing protein, partial [Blastocatellia bacterium]
NPTIREIHAGSARREGPSLTIIEKEFGYLTAALRVAGFETRYRYVTRGQLIAQLRSLTRALHRIPTLKDVKLAKGSSGKTFKKFFGNFNQARKAAKLDEVLKKATGHPAVLPREPKVYERQELILHLHDLSRSLGRLPLTTDIQRSSKERGTPSMGPYRRLFGTLQQAHTAAGLSEDPGR